MENLNQQQRELKKHHVSIMITAESELDLKDVKSCIGEVLIKQFGPASVYVPKYVRFSKRYQNYVATVEVECPQRSFSSGGINLFKKIEPP